MKIVSRSPSELIIRHNATLLRWFGIFVIALGTLAMWIGFAGEPGSIVPVAIGGVLVAGGAAMTILPARSTFAFSRTERAFIIVRQRLLRGVERQVLPLRDVADVTLEQSRDSEGGSMYRVATTLVDQRRVPWTSYYSSGYASKRTVVDAAREFLHLEASPKLGSGNPTAPANARAARHERGLLTVMALFCLAFVAVGAVTLAKEHHRLSTYEPVAATVLSTRVERRSDSDGGTTYRPVVVYRYDVGGREYTASRVTPLEESRSGRWAHRLTARFAVGGRYTAYYDPAEPGAAFLVRTRSILPWAFIVIPLVMLLIIGASMRWSRENQVVP